MSGSDFSMTRLEKLSFVVLGVTRVATRLRRYYRAVAMAAACAH
jgi:hypothetical protein